MEVTNHKELDRIQIAVYNLWDKSHCDTWISWTLSSPELVQNGLGTFSLSLGNFEQISKVAKICSSCYSLVINYPPNLGHSRDMMSGSFSSEDSEAGDWNHTEASTLIFHAISFWLSPGTSAGFSTRTLYMWPFHVAVWLPHSMWLGSKSRCLKRQERTLEAVIFLRPRNWIA